MIYHISVRTRERVEFRDITLEIQDIITAGGIKNGVCYLFVPHTTAAITVNEHADPDVVRDIAAQLDDMVPQNKSYSHREGNAAAHIKAALVGNSVTLPVENGKLVLGTWQGVFFCEFDGPRSRTLLVKTIPG